MQLVADLTITGPEISPEIVAGLLGRWVRADVDAEKRSIMGPVSDVDSLTVTIGGLYRGLVSSVTVTEDNRVRLTLRWVEDV